MSILDDAIREHLELKRAHGADESEVKKLEDEAFGPAQRPDGSDPFAEAPTEFLTAPGEEGAGETDAADPEGRRVPNITDLQEAPPAPFDAESVPEEPPPAAPEAAEPAAPEPPAAQEPSEPSVEEHPAMEHEAIPPETAEPEVEAPSPEVRQPDGAHNTEEREAIAQQPTEFFDVQGEIGSPDPAPPPREPEPDPEEDDFFSEQRLSEELDQALEAPVTDEHEALPDPPPAEPPPPAPQPTEEGTAIYDVEAEQGHDKGGYEDDDSDEHNAFEPETDSHDDVLEDTPEFLEDAPDADDAWFEQRPPKDFDFDD
jgi:hypothetical protein